MPNEDEAIRIAAELARPRAGELNRAADVGPARGVRDPRRVATYVAKRPRRAAESGRQRLDVAGSCMEGSRATRKKDDRRHGIPVLWREDVERDGALAAPHGSGSVKGTSVSTWSPATSASGNAPAVRTGRDVGSARIH